MSSTPESNDRDSVRFEGAGSPEEVRAARQRKLAEIRMRKERKDALALERIRAVLPKNVIREMRDTALRKQKTVPKKPKPFHWDPDASREESNDEAQ